MSDQPANFTGAAPTNPNDSQGDQTTPAPVVAPSTPDPMPTADTSSSYVGNYVPPVMPAMPTMPSMPSMPAAPPVMEPLQTMSAAPSTPSDVSSSSVASTSSAPSDAAVTPSVSQALEDQNIFHLLGVTDGTDEEKEAFLDELQQVIWEDFVENDVELLVTEDEMTQFRQIVDKNYEDEAQKQEDMIVFLEKLIPDLEEIMLEKALELKEDMVRERIAGMREYYASDADALKQMDEAERLVNADQWRQAADVLNAVSR